MFLKSNDSLEVLLAAGMTSSHCPLIASFLDTLADLSAGTPDGSDTVTNGTSAVTMVTAPASGYVRQIKYLSIRNDDSVTHTVTVRKNNGSTTRKMIAITLLSGERADFIETTGWRVFATDGTPKGSSVVSVNSETGAVRTPCDFIVAIGDETTSITTGTAKVTFRATRAMTITKIKASLSTAGSGSSAFDVNKNGGSVFSTTLTIDASEKTSESAATPAVLSGGSLSLAADDEITVDIDMAGSGAKGPKITFIGTF